MRRVFALFVPTLWLLSAPGAHADDDLWFGIKAGTLGLGLEATWRPVPYLDVRGGFNAFRYDFDASESGVEYDAQLDLRTLYATANLRMPLSPFRVTAGLFSNGNELNLVTRDSATVEVGGTTYTAAQIGRLEARADFDGVAPYVGVGLDFRVANTLGVSVDLGVLRQGSPSITAIASGPIASDPAFQSELESERQQLEAELDDYDLYPVLSIGLNVNF
jgi:hypothetical protein